MAETGSGELRLAPKGVTMEIFVAAEKMSVRRALVIGLVDALVEDPVSEALRRVRF